MNMKYIGSQPENEEKVCSCDKDMGAKLRKGSDRHDLKQEYVS